MASSSITNSETAKDSKTAAAPPPPKRSRSRQRHRSRSRSKSPTKEGRDALRRDIHSRSRSRSRSRSSEQLAAVFQPPPPPVATAAASEPVRVTISKPIWAFQKNKIRRLFEKLEASSDGIRIIKSPDFGYRFSDEPWFTSNISCATETQFKKSWYLMRNCWVPASDESEKSGLPIPPLAMKNGVRMTVQYHVALPFKLEQEYSDYRFPGHTWWTADFGRAPPPIELALKEDPHSDWGTTKYCKRYWYDSSTDDNLFVHVFEFEFDANDIVKHGKNWVNLSKLGCQLVCLDDASISTSVWVNGSKIKRCADCTDEEKSKTVRCFHCQRCMPCCLAARKSQPPEKDGSKPLYRRCPAAEQPRVLSAATTASAASTAIAASSAAASAK